MIKLMLVMTGLFFIFGIIPLAFIIRGLTKIKIPKLARYILGTAYLVIMSELIAYWLYNPNNPLLKWLNIE